MEPGIPGASLFAPKLKDCVPSCGSPGKLHVGIPLAPASPDPNSATEAVAWQAAAGTWNQVEAIESLVKNCSSISATFFRPDSEGCVPSPGLKSAHSQIS